eukprot:CAMPEP_0170511286 /NCGR_PEP_ID=MMETSP0208-20121228/66227_1 /TAXON_ID=197538 /ORGANISM="Strombidium inclinatum, Strain S3" /LENGTH=61 /DNA_ID=CAMNT_0010794817 /DNA_START=147 /DNA_END=332 /DNA_ORIENTATION=+
MTFKKERKPAPDTLRSQESQQEDPLVQFQKNPNLGNVIKKLEERQAIKSRDGAGELTLDLL